MGCKDKISRTCGKKINAKCVDYEGEFHENTELDVCDGSSVEDVIEDINKQVDSLSSSLDLSELGDACIIYTPTGESLLAKDAFLAMEAKICELAEYVGLPTPGCDGCHDCSPIFEESIECANLDLGGLVDDCGVQPSTLKELLQLLLDKLNE